MSLISDDEKMTGVGLKKGSDLCRRPLSLNTLTLRLSLRESVGS